MLQDSTLQAATRHGLLDIDKSRDKAIQHPFMRWLNKKQCHNCPRSGGTRQVSKNVLSEVWGDETGKQECVVRGLGGRDR